jgi:hypothetical protein
MQPCEFQRTATVTLGVVVTGPHFSWGDTYRMISPTSFAYEEAVANKRHTTLGIIPDTGVALLPVDIVDIFAKAVCSHLRESLVLPVPRKSCLCLNSVSAEALTHGLPSPPCWKIARMRSSAVRCSRLSLSLSCSSLILVPVKQQSFCSFL